MDLPVDAERMLRKANLEKARSDVFMLSVGRGNALPDDEFLSELERRVHKMRDLSASFQAAPGGPAGSVAAQAEDSATAARILADSYDHLALTYGQHGDHDKSATAYAFAVEQWQAAGDTAAADSSDSFRAQQELFQDHDVDRELVRLIDAVDRSGAHTLDRVQALTDLGLLYLRAGDRFEARSTLLEAEQAYAAATATREPLAGSYADAAKMIDGKNPAHGVAAVVGQARSDSLRRILGYAAAKAADEPEAARRYLWWARTARFPEATPAQLGGANPIWRPDDPEELYGSLVALDAGMAAPEPPALLRQCEELRWRMKQAGAVDLLAAVARRQADLLLQVGRRLEAIAVATEGLQLLVDGRHEYDVQIGLLRALSDCHAAGSDWAAVRETTERGIRIVEKYRYGISAAYLTDSYMADRVRLYQLAAVAAAKQGDDFGVLGVAELAKARGLARRVQLDAHVAEELGEIDRSIAAARADRPEAERLTSRRRRLWDRMVAGGASWETAAPPLSRVQSRLRNDEAALYYFWLDHSSLVCCVLRRDSVALEIRSVPPQVASRLATWAARVLASEVSAANVEPLVTNPELCALLLPAEPRRLAGCRRLFISPHQVLHLLPFHALRWQGCALLESFAVTYLPNLSTLLTDVPRPGPDTLVVGVGDYHRMPDVYGQLPGVTGQVQDVVGIHRLACRPARGLCDGDATKAALERLAAGGELARAGCLQFITHGDSVLSDTPLESHLVLYDDFLDGLDIARWKLSGAHVALAACCAGQRAVAGRGRAELAGDEVLGLQGAFFAAGAQSVAGSLWTAQVHVVGAVFTAFHQLLTTTGLAPDEVLRQALLGYRASAPRMNKNDFYWAPFFLVARGRPEPI